MNTTVRDTMPTHMETAAKSRLLPQFWRSVNGDELFARVMDEENRQFVQTTLRALSPDPVWKNWILAQVAQSRPELRSVLAWLARETRPGAYLEVGVRRGFSAAMIAARCPTADIFGFDMWVSNYAGVANPGPRFVRAQLRQLGYRGSCYLIGGDSHKTLPAFFGDGRAQITDRILLWMTSRRSPAAFDLVTIDGDHSLLGAHQDLMDTMPRCAIGGAVVFDDIAPDRAPVAALEAERGPDPYGWRDLLGVWKAAQDRFQNFRFFEYLDHPPGVGVAVRLS